MNERVFELTDDGGARTGVASARELWTPLPKGTDAHGRALEAPRRLFSIESIRVVLDSKAKAKLKVEPHLRVLLNARIVFAAPLFSCEAALPIRFDVASNDEVDIRVCGGQGAAPDVAVHFGVAGERPYPEQPQDLWGNGA